MSSKSNLSLSSVILLEKKDDYDTWRSQMQDYLVLAKLWIVCDPLKPQIIPTQLEGEEITSFTKRLDTYNEKVQEALTSIGNRLSKAYKDSIIGDTPANFLSNIQKTCKPKGTTNFMAYAQDLLAVNRKNYVDVNEYASAQLTVYRNLEGLSVDAKLSDAWKIMLFIRGLGPAFDKFRDRVESYNTWLSDGGRL
jgi:hypothetical protein